MSDEFDYQVFRAELDEDKIQAIQFMRREWCDRYPYRPNLLIVKEGYFENLQRPSVIFGMEIMVVEFLADHQGNEIFFAFGVKK